MKTKIKVVKPVGSMVDFQYICPNRDCGLEHWTTQKESQTKNFKIVCDCGEVFKTKQIDSIQIVYTKIAEKPSLKQKQTTKAFQAKPSPKAVAKVVKKPKFDFIKDAVNTLIKFGFEKQESAEMIQQSFEKTKSENPATLVKDALDFFGNTNK